MVSVKRNVPKVLRGTVKIYRWEIRRGPRHFAAAPERSVLKRSVNRPLGLNFEKYNTKSREAV